MIPAFYALLYKLFFMSAVLSFLSFSSFNFWRKPNYSWRRIFDRVYAKFAFSVCLFNGIRFFYFDPFTPFAFISFVFFYFLSNLFCNDSLCFTNSINPIWLKFHFLFHSRASFVQFMVVHWMIRFYQL